LGLWPQIVQAAWQQQAWLLFGDEASFAWCRSLGYTWAPVGQQLAVKTNGQRKGYQVFGLLKWFSAPLFWVGQEGRCNAESYCQFLAQVHV
jgi:hypothetical protein